MLSKYKPKRLHRAVPVWLCLISTIVLCGCSRQPRIAHANDRLRERVAMLEADVSRLKLRNSELESRQAAHVAGPKQVDPAIDRNMPRLASIEVGRLSHAVDEDGDGFADAIALYLHPRDGWSRFVQIVGTLSVNVAVVPASGTPRSIGQVVFDPDAVREAHRSGISGTHYTFRIPISPSRSADQPDAVIAVEFQDGLSGRVLTASRTATLRPAGTGSALGSFGR